MMKESNDQASNLGTEDVDRIFWDDMGERSFWGDYELKLFPVQSCDICVPNIIALFKIVQYEPQSLGEKRGDECNIKKFVSVILKTETSQKW